MGEDSRREEGGKGEMGGGCNQIFTAGTEHWLRIRRRQAEQGSTGPLAAA